MIDPKMKKSKGVYVCVVCDSPLNDLTIKHLDPFCKTQCANIYYEFVPATAQVTLGGEAK